MSRFALLSHDVGFKFLIEECVTSDTRTEILILCEYQMPQEFIFETMYD